MVKLDRPRHQLVDCPCGHTSHITQADQLAEETSDGSVMKVRNRLVRTARCEACESRERALAIRLTFVRASTADHLNLRPEMVVMVGGQRCVIASIERVTRLDGAVKTPFCAVAIRRAVA